MAIEVARRPGLTTGGIGPRDLEGRCPLAQNSEPHAQSVEWIISSVPHPQAPTMCLELFTCSSRASHYPGSMQGAVTPVSWRRKPEFRAVKRFIQGHTAGTMARSEPRERGKRPACTAPRFSWKGWSEGAHDLDPELWLPACSRAVVWLAVHIPERQDQRWLVWGRDTSGV